MNEQHNNFSPQDMIAQAVQQQQILKQTAPAEEDDRSKWELDTEPWLDRVYHELLGEIQDDKGEWVRDTKRERIMNELGASAFISELSARISIHMQMSELSDQDVLEISSRAGESYANKLEDFWEEWEINPTEANFESISQRLYDTLFITLMIAKSGGMKHHREKIRNPYANMPTQHKEEML